jgi:hypothetical protein
VRRATASEHSHQVAVMKWAALSRGRWPELRLLFHIPNGGSRHILEAVRLKQAGVRPGVPDLCLPVPRGKFHGLFIEMKSLTGKTSTEQDGWIDSLKKLGYQAMVCKGADEARRAITNYLQEAA